MNKQKSLFVLVMGTMALTACTSQELLTTLQVLQGPVATMQQTKSTMSMEQGVWQDPKTGLIWDRCALGQTWTGTTCKGEPISFEWQDAKEYIEKFANGQARYGYADWRLPTVQELASIRHCYEEGWEQDTETVSELTTQGRVQKAVSKGLTVRTITVNDNQIVELPVGCKARAYKIQVNNSAFPNNSGNLPYWSSSYASSDANFRQMWSVDFTNGNLEGHFGNQKLFVRAVRSQ